VRFTGTLAAGLAVALAGPAWAQAQQGMVTNSPAAQPPIIAVPSAPGMPAYALPPGVYRPPEPPPLPPGARIVRPPQPRAVAQSLISRDDYPAAALAMRAHGRVRFRLLIGPDGRVAGCAITRSSGSPVLDSTTCRLIRRRARFTPAVDSNGNPAAGTVEDQIVWRLP